jgi:CRP/FNR family cyclic AMP-dependent transcriptional regulator
MPEVTVETLKLVPLFAGLDDAALGQLASSTRRMTLREGDVLFKEGEAGETLCVVEDGCLKVFVHGLDDQEIVLDLVGPDGVIGELALLDGQPRSATVQALSASTLLALDREPFLTHLYQHAETAIHLLRVISHSLRQRVLEAETSSESDSSARLAHTLLFLAEKDGRIEPGLVTSTLRTKHLAAAVGTSEEWVKQTLHEWCREGIIGMTGSRRLLLHDVEALKTLSGWED